MLNAASRDTFCGWLTNRANQVSALTGAYANCQRCIADASLDTGEVLGGLRIGAIWKHQASRASANIVSATRSLVSRALQQVSPGTSAGAVIEFDEVARHQAHQHTPNAQPVSRGSRRFT